MAAPNLFLFRLDHGLGRLLHIREDELVLFNEHRLDPLLVNDCLPCGHREQALVHIARVVLERGRPKSDGCGTLRLRRRDLTSQQHALVRFLTAATLVEPRTLLVSSPAAAR